MNTTAEIAYIHAASTEERLSAGYIILCSKVQSTGTVTSRRRSVRTHFVLADIDDNKGLRQSNHSQSPGVEAFASSAVDTRLKSRFHPSSHTSEIQIAILVSTLPDTWRYRASTQTGWPDVSILWLGEIANLICNLYLYVAVCTIVSTDPSTTFVAGTFKHPTNQPASHS